MNKSSGQIVSGMIGEAFLSIFMTLFCLYVISFPFFGTLLAMGLTITYFEKKGWNSTEMFLPVVLSMCAQATFSFFVIKFLCGKS